MAEGPTAQPSNSSSDQPSSSQLINLDEGKIISSEAPTSDGSKSSNGNIPTFPVMYPTFVQGLMPQHQEQINRGPGLYAVPVMPYLQPIAGFSSNTLIPFTYNLPTERISPDTREVGGGQQVQQQGDQPQQRGPQRQVVRRFQIAIHLDLLLILKLAAVIFLFNQDGSKQRLTLLMFFASLVYLYQTGALAPMVRSLSQGMRRAAAPPPRPAAPNNLPNVEGQQQPVGENENEEDGNRAAHIENDEQHAAGEAGNRWWGIVKEIQMFVFGFITSLLPGFHNNID